MNDWDVNDSDLRDDALGLGWEQAERALAALQADLSGTVAGAPTLMLLWKDLPDVQVRWAYLGKGRDWYYGADGGFELPRSYADAVLAIAGELQSAIEDTLLGYHAYWPHCPGDDYPLQVSVRAEQCVWTCTHGRHDVAAVGSLGRQY